MRAPRFERLACVPDCPLSPHGRPPRRVQDNPTAQAVPVAVQHERRDYWLLKSCARATSPNVGPGRCVRACGFIVLPLRFFCRLCDGGDLPPLPRRKSAQLAHAEIMPEPTEEYGSLSHHRHYHHKHHHKHHKHHKHHHHHTHVATICVVWYAWGQLCAMRRMISGIIVPTTTTATADTQKYWTDTRN
jgi:hypothetical protein